jgi:hypothetical protein
MEELENIVEQLELENDKRQASDPLTQASLNVVEDFLKKHKVMCYGGTAINNLLPPEDRFYDPEVDVPDYDFFSKTPQEHSVMIANKLRETGIKTIEVKPGMHLGTFKVFADYSGIADITHLDNEIFDRLWEKSVVKDRIHYVPPNFLRMSMYLELSRPRGDVSRWAKVFSRLQLLNKHYPIECPVEKLEHKPASDDDIERVVKLLKKEDVVLLSATAAEVHLHKKWTLPIGLLATKETIEKLTKGKKVFIQEANDILPRMHVIDDEGIRFYETSACHSYHKTRDGIKVASIPTILQFFFAYIYSNASDENIASILCIAQRLVELANEKPKRRFALLTPIDCIGTQETLIDMRKHKSVLFEKLSKNKNSAEFLKYFFTYNPHVTTTQRRRVRDSLRKTRKARS